MESIGIDEKIVEELKRKIIFMENQNLRNKEKSDNKMVDCIKKLIEGAVKC